MPIRDFMGGFGGGPRDRGPRDRGFGGGPRDRGPRGGGLFSGVRLFHGPMRFMFFGRPIILSTGRQVGFMCGFVALLVMIVSTMATFFNLKSNKVDLVYYQNQLAVYNDYKSIVDNAYLFDDDDNFYFVYGTVTSVNADKNYYGVRTGYYTFNYSFTDANGDAHYNLETQTVYYCPYYERTHSEDDIDYSIGDDIIIAYELTENGVRAIEYDFSDTYDDDVPYINSEISNLKTSIKTQTTTFVILIIVLAGVVAIIILMVVKTIKKSRQKEALEKAKMQAEVKEAEAKAQEAQTHADMSHRYCLYCGVKFPDNESKCPNCGSSHFEIKK